MTEAQIKQAVRERDGFKCVECGMTQEQHYEKYGRDLEVHRDPPGAPYSIDICVTMCRVCHGPMPRRRHHSRPYVKIDDDLAEMLYFTALVEKMKASKIVSDLIRKPIRKLYLRTIRKVIRECERMRKNQI